jgi:UDP-glucose 4-epimerase
MHRALVSGGCGFIGSHLVERLLADGLEVHVLDDLSTGRMENLPKHPKLTIYLLDLASTPKENLWNRLPPCDTIFHLACHPRQSSFQHPWRDMKVNLGSTITLLDCAKQWGAKLVFSSNSGIYGAAPPDGRIDEGFRDQPSTPYDVHKLASEHLIQVYRDTYKLSATIFRFATVYGPRQRPTYDWKPVVPTFIDCLLRGEAPEVWGDGSSTRDFIYVTDIVGALILAGNRETPGNPILLATGRETSIRRLLEELQSLTGRTDLAPTHVPEKPGEVRRMIYSWKRAQHILEWSPTIDLYEGLRRTVEWWRKQK